MANALLPLLRYVHRLAAGSTDDDLDDGQLLERFVRHQDEAAFAVLLRRHARMVWNVCVRVLRNSQDAEDVFQATFLVLVRRADSIARAERLANWLYGVAFRVARKSRARADRRLARHKEMADMRANDRGAAPRWGELAAVLDEEMQRLPGKYREPLVLCYLQGLSNREAARRLGCAEGTLSSYLTRARQRLRQRLRRRGLVVPAAALAALLADNAASAAVPVALLASTASLIPALLAAGQPTASVAALTEGVLKDMTRIKLKLAAGFLAAAVALAGSGWGLRQALADKPATEGARPADKAPHASKLDLTPENSARLLAAVRPQGNEWRHLKVHWYTDIVAARKKAAAEDKPILVFRTGGAGYNDPLGQC